MEDCFSPFDSPLFSINKKLSLLLVQTVCKYILGKKRRPFGFGNISAVDSNSIIFERSKKIKFLNSLKLNQSLSFYLD